MIPRPLAFLRNRSKPPHSAAASAPRARSTAAHAQPTSAAPTVRLPSARLPLPRRAHPDKIHAAPWSQSKNDAAFQNSAPSRIRMSCNSRRPQRLSSIGVFPFEGHVHSGPVCAWGLSPSATVRRALPIAPIRCIHRKEGCFLPRPQRIHRIQRALPYRDFADAACTIAPSAFIAFSRCCASQ